MKKYAKSAYIEGKKIELKSVLGEGATSIAYLGKDNQIYKEFFPIRDDNDEYYYTRLDNGSVEKSANLSPKDEAVLQEKYKKFLAIEDVSTAIYNTRAENNLTPLLSWDKKEGDDGRAWFKSKFTAGVTLKEKFKRIDEEKDPIVRFQEELKCVKDVLLDLENYAKAGYIHLDVKPDNFLSVYVNAEGEAESIRNLDFGSCLKVEEILFNDKLVFECSPKHFDYPKFIKAILQDTTQSNDQKRHNLMLLDVKAAMKILAERLCGGEYNESAHKGWFLERIYNQYFAKEGLCFGEYAIADFLATLLARNNISMPFDGMDLRDNTRYIQSALDMLDYLKRGTAPASEPALRIRELKKFNHLLKGKTREEAFKKNGLWRTTSEVLESLSLIKQEFTPTISFRGDSLRTGEEFSILSLFSKCQEAERSVKNLLLLAEGGMGKTANLEYLRLRLLKKNIPVYSYEIKWLTKETKSAFKKEIEGIKSFLKNTVVILDGYDELDLSMKNDVDKLIKEELKGKCKLCIIGSRVASTQSEEEKSAETLFSGFEMACLCPFEREEILERIQRENEKGIAYFPLLRNTMFLLMHCEFERLKKERMDFPDIITEADFIGQYLTALFQNKGADFPIATIFHLGQFLHKQRSDESRLAPEIPAPIMHIVEYVQKGKDKKKHEQYQEVLAAVQVKYLNYLQAFYIYKTLELLLVEEKQKRREIQIKELFRVSCTEMVAEAFYYAGQLLRSHSSKRKIFQMLNGDALKKELRYENVLCLFLGAYDGVAKDIEGVFTFYHSSMRYTAPNFIYAAAYIKELKAKSIENLKFAKGAQNIQKIALDNDVFYSKNNCAITRFGDELHLACNSTRRIPDGVKKIQSNAFSHLKLRKIVVPDSVEEIASYAFLYCEGMEHLVLGKGLKKLDVHAVYKCSDLKILEITNGESFVVDRENGYHIGAFVRIPKLERVVVPTTALSYLYAVFEEQKSELIYYKKKKGEKKSTQVKELSLKRLELFQGVESTIFTKTGAEKLSKGFEFFKHLHICADVKKLSEDTLKYFFNGVEKITVAKGNERYRTIQNCLIDTENSVLLLGRNNGHIPQDDKIKRIGDFAFTQCDAIQEMFVPEGVEEIGVNSFAFCSNLRKIFLPKSLKRIGVQKTSTTIFDVNAHETIFLTSGTQSSTDKGKHLRAQYQKQVQRDYKKFISSIKIKTCKASLKLAKKSEDALQEMKLVTLKPRASSFSRGELLKSIACSPFERVKEQARNETFKGCGVEIQFNGASAEWAAITNGCEMEGVKTVDCKE